MGLALTEATPCADHRAMTEAAPLPLARFTIVELNDADAPLCLRLATSLAAKVAADLGADVLKIEPPGGDPVRRAPPLLPQGGRRSIPVSCSPPSPARATPDRNA
jgi:crotonobetainyl-CoA:carnitine CoA-transferase CaiB-like acyl-CoA transferase